MRLSVTDGCLLHMPSVIQHFIGQNWAVRIVIYCLIGGQMSLSCQVLLARRLYCNMRHDWLGDSFWVPVSNWLHVIASWWGTAQINCSPVIYNLYVLHVYGSILMWYSWNRSWEVRCSCKSYASFLLRDVAFASCQVCSKTVFLYIWEYVYLL